MRNAAERAGLGPNDVELLTAATTMPDVMGPGHASMVHGELGYGPLEIATAHGICSSGMMALKNAYLQVAIGEKRNAICVASEFASRGFKSTRYDEMRAISEDGSLPMETAFLRYMLSDGAGAAVVESAPATSGISLRIDWISLTSYANTQKACMFFGSNDNACEKTWGDYPTAAAAAADGALAPRQKLSLLPHLVRVGIDEYERLLAMGKFDPKTVTWFPVHYSSERMKTMVLGELSRRDVATGRPEMWYSNLTESRKHRQRSHLRHPRRDDDRGPDQGRRHAAVHGPRVRPVRHLVHASHRGVGGYRVGNPAMTRASEVLPAEQRPPRAVVYLYSQTGQLREVADALTAPLVARGWDIRWVDVQPRVAFPFPWPIRRFFGVFPAAVDPEALVELVEPAGGFDTDPEELVILAYQVWYLAPSLPIRSLLKAHPEAVRNRRVVSLIACRNMWYSAAIEVSGLLQSAGARSVEVVAATDTRRQSTTLVTTLRWLLTGRREPFLWFGRAGIGDAELARVADVGRCIAESGQCPQAAAPIVPTLAAADLLAGTVFRRWGATVRSARRFGALAQAASLATFVLGLGIGIVVGMPLIGCAALAGGARFDTVVGGFVRRRISFGGAAVYEAAIA